MHSALRQRRTTISDLIEGIVADDLCIGCGACTALVPGLVMRLSADGRLHPSWRSGFADSSSGACGVDEFTQVCPAVSVFLRREAGAKWSDVFGPYVRAYVGTARDEKFRFAGSSAGVLTALSAWGLESGTVDAVHSVGKLAGSAPYASATSFSDSSAVLDHAGSRYTPAALLEGESIDPSKMYVGRPCEISSVRALSRRDPAGRDPLTLSFFCAGVPSSLATDRLVGALGIETNDVKGIRYRGMGWPGQFVVETHSGVVGRANYETSWGQYLGRDLPWRCKICPDGLGMDADVAVGDYWHCDERGFPKFEGAAPRSVVIARTRRGEAFLRAAADAGYVSLNPIELSLVSSVQPLQLRRRQTILARLLASRLAGVRVPSFVGFRMSRNMIAHPLYSLKAAHDSLVRLLRRRG